MSQHALVRGETGDSHLRASLKLAVTATACGLLSLLPALSARSEARHHASLGGQEQQGAGAYFNAEASGKDVGLPIYPGARPHTDKDDEKSSAKFGLWGNAFAFKLAVVKLETNDSPEKVAAFYKKALAKYGTVLDCRNAPSEANEKSESSNQLTCESDKPDSANMLFKSGTKEKQHVVGIDPNGKGSIIKLVYVESPDSGKK